MGVNVSGDFVRVGSAGVSAIAFSKIGAMIGTAITPGIGTVIGGGLGAIAGAMGAGMAIRWIKEKIKWGDIIKALDYFGEKIPSHFTIVMRDNIKNEIFNLKKIENQISHENDLKKRYKKELNPYKSSTPLLSSVLVHLHYEQLKSLRKKINKSIKKTEKDIRELCKQAAKNINEDDQKKYFKRYWAEFILANGKSFLPLNLNEEEQHLYDKYLAKKKKAPNHPYKFANEPADILNGLAIRNMLLSKSNPHIYYGFNWIRFTTFTVISIVLFYFLVLHQIL